MWVTLITTQKSFVATVCYIQTLSRQRDPSHCLDVSTLIDARSQRSRCLHWNRTFHSMKCVPSHTHRGLWSLSHSVSTSLMSRQRSNIDFMRRAKLENSLNSKTRKNIKITCFVEMSQNARFWGGPKITQNWPFWGGQKTTIFGVQNPKNHSRGTQCYGDTRRIIYCLDTRYGPPKPCFWPFLGAPDETRGVSKTCILAHTFCTHFHTF